jgi:Tfp pilus assembly protein PilE
MKGSVVFVRQIAGQGMTEYIIVVALIAVAAIGVYTAFGDVIRGQTSVAAVALSGEANTSGRSLVTNGRSKANEQATSKSLKDFEK